MRKNTRCYSCGRKRKPGHEKRVGTALAYSNCRPYEESAVEGRELRRLLKKERLEQLAEEEKIWEEGVKQRAEAKVKAAEEKEKQQKEKEKSKKAPKVTVVKKEEPPEPEVVEVEEEEEPEAREREFFGKMCREISLGIWRPIENIEEEKKEVA